MISGINNTPNIANISRLDTDLGIKKEGLNNSISDISTKLMDKDGLDSIRNGLNNGASTEDIINRLSKMLGISEEELKNKIDSMPGKDDQEKLLAYLNQLESLTRDQGANDSIDGGAQGGGGGQVGGGETVDQGLGMHQPEYDIETDNGKIKFYGSKQDAEKAQKEVLGLMKNDPDVKAAFNDRLKEHGGEYHISITNLPPDRIGQAQVGGNSMEISPNRKIGEGFDNTITHELGHSLGYGHSEKHTGVTYALTDGNKSRDIHYAPERDGLLGPA